MSGPDGLAERVQRTVHGEIPVLHLEAEIPSGTWPLVVDGAVRRPVRIPMDEIHDLPTHRRRDDLHCVWGWSRPDVGWEGIALDDLIERVRPLATADYVVVRARESPYASCLTLEEAREGILAWRMEGRDLSPERGWPLRFVAPPGKWAYKHVKWAERITFVQRFVPGFWEERVGDVRGDIPSEVLERFSSRGVDPA